MWAAYRRNALNGHFGDGLDRDGFVYEAVSSISRIIQAGGDVHVLIAPTTRGEIPVGVITALVFQYRVYPHVDWFPEASARNKIECIVHYLQEIKRVIHANVVSRPEDVHFFDHICKYGLLRRVGTLRKYHPDGANAELYETVG